MANKKILWVFWSQLNIKMTKITSAKSAEPNSTARSSTVVSSTEIDKNFTGICASCSNCTYVDWSLLSNHQKLGKHNSITIQLFTIWPFYVSIETGFLVNANTLIFWSGMGSNISGHWNSSSETNCLNPSFLLSNAFISTHSGSIVVSSRSEI